LAVTVHMCPPRPALTTILVLPVLQHGPPSDVNSHPHVSSDAAEFVVVHNGIISNFSQLRSFLVGPCPACYRLMGCLPPSDVLHEPAVGSPAVVTVPCASAWSVNHA
jgi:hypothetical protein